jgi:hypothetical protein
VSLLDADRHGATHDESDALARPLPALSAARPVLGRLPGRMKLGGRLSEGIALGTDTGFDSGSTLDYVYRNTATGNGRWAGIDRNYLDAIGWRGIRQRKRTWKNSCAWPSAGCTPRAAPCGCWTSPPATAATCSKP